MNFDLENDVMNVATELFSLVMAETKRASEAQFQEAVDHAVRNVL
jgi:hypothetical protein